MSSINTAPKRTVAIICGGPSAERGISLNSARSLYDNLDKGLYEVIIIYFNPLLKPYRITSVQIYSNTPLDFDYKLHHSDQALSQEQLSTLLQSVDVVFPAIHGTFGEDGQLQKILEDMGVSYVGSGTEACHITSDKHLCQKILKEKGFYSVPDWVIKKNAGKKNVYAEKETTLERVSLKNKNNLTFTNEDIVAPDPLKTLQNLDPGRYVLKPLHGGSSIGVEYIIVPSSPQTLQQALDRVFMYEEEALIEPFVEGTEFTIIVLENDKKEPVSLLPTEIEFSQQSTDAFFNYRKKYLATAETRYHTPARFTPEVIDKIRKEAEKAFQVLGMKDFARLDGWLLPDGTIWFSDINAISGMEQNSFLFQQASLLGLSHHQLLQYILEKNLDRKKTAQDTNYASNKSTVQEQREKQEIPILFGGDTAERQVSVMSGTNVWMKLKFSPYYMPLPIFLDAEGKLYKIPAFFCLHHTVEEIQEKINEWMTQPHRLDSIEDMLHPVRDKLGIHREQCEELSFIPTEISLEDLAQQYKFIFLGLHGGIGENGTLQAKLDQLGVSYNGPGAACSALCMDKFATGEKITQAQIPGISTAKKSIVSLKDNPEKIWHHLLEKGFRPPFIVKPRSDGCSAGIIKLNDLEHFIKVFTFLQERKPFIPANFIHENHGQIDLPSSLEEEMLVEEFIMTDVVFIKNLTIEWRGVSDYIEVTVGVLGTKNNLKSLYPSQTIASQEVLSLEEKFMGGTGINLTPPPDDFVKAEIIAKVQEKIVEVANLLDIEGYARVDIFMNIKNGDIIVIEANTLPALTPSTVLFHQGLAERPPFTPRELIEKIIEIGQKKLGSS